MQFHLQSICSIHEEWGHVIHTFESERNLTHLLQVLLEHSKLVIVVFALLLFHHFVGRPSSLIVLFVRMIVITLRVFVLAIEKVVSEVVRPVIKRTGERSWHTAALAGPSIIPKVLILRQDIGIWTCGEGWADEWGARPGGEVGRELRLLGSWRRCHGLLRRSTTDTCRQVAQHTEAT